MQKAKRRNNNYFKVSVYDENTGRTYDGYHFFDATNLDSTIGAWRESSLQAAANDGAALSMFSVPRVRGQWDTVACVVGHRHHDSIMGDILATASAGDAEANNAYHEEMDQLQALWRGLMDAEERH